MKHDTPHPGEMRDTTEGARAATDDPADKHSPIDPKKVKVSATEGGAGDAVKVTIACEPAPDPKEQAKAQENFDAKAREAAQKAKARKLGQMPTGTGPKNPLAKPPAKPLPKPESIDMPDPFVDVPPPPEPTEPTLPEAPVAALPDTSPHPIDPPQVRAFKANVDKLLVPFARIDEARQAKIELLEAEHAVANAASVEDGMKLLPVRQAAADKQLVARLQADAIRSSFDHMRKVLGPQCNLAAHGVVAVLAAIEAPLLEIKEHLHGERGTDNPLVYCQQLRGVITTNSRIPANATDAEVVSSLAGMLANWRRALDDVPAIKQRHREEVERIREELAESVPA